jgi:hypothetical protein
MTTLKKIRLNGSNTNDTIVPFEKQYLVNVCGRWRAGTFDSQWFGLNFTNYGSEGIELEALDEVYEIADETAEVTTGLPAAYLEYA